MKTIEKAFTVILLAGAISSCATKYFTNPVIDAPLPDPTVIREGDTYVMAGTSGGAKPVYPIYISKNLVDWTAAGSIFTDYPERSEEHTSELQSRQYLACRLLLE